MQETFDAMLAALQRLDANQQKTNEWLLSLEKAVGTGFTALDQRLNRVEERIGNVEGQLMSMNDWLGSIDSKLSSIG